jgi:uncharacterized phage protein gp47/JayE
MPYGVTDGGFVRKTLDEIKTDTEQRQREVFGDTWDVEPTAPDGVMNGIDASQKDELWQGLEGAHASVDPDKATGGSLDIIGALRGIPRLKATRSIVPGTANIGAGISVSAQALIVSVASNPAARFRNRYAFTNPGGSADDIDVTWEAVDTGPTVANNGTLTVIDSPLAGVNSVVNGEDAIIGRHVEQDDAYRLRQEDEAGNAAGAVLAAIKTKLLNIDGVLQAIVYNNRTDATVDGIPRNSVECVVMGGDDDEVAQVVFDSVAAGIGFHGTETLTAIDPEGIVQPVKFTRPTELLMYLRIDVTDVIGYGGDAAVKQAVALYGNDVFDISDDVILSRFYASIFGVGGVADVTTIRIGTSPSPVSTANFVVGAREIARFDTSRIVVNS